MKTLIPILLLLVSGVAHVEEPIIGAFGMTLGEVADGDLYDRVTKDGYLGYNFIPETPVNPFRGYRVEVTPVKELVFIIRAWGSMGNEGCIASYNAFKKALDRKYGVSVTPETSGGTRKAKWSRKRGEEGFRSISLSCSSSYYIYLAYRDYFVEAGMADELNAETESDNL